MKNLSIAADIALRIAAHEAASSGYHYLEKEHLLIGIASIEKIIAGRPEQAGIDQAAWNNLILSGKFKEHKVWYADLENEGIIFLPL